MASALNRSAARSLLVMLVSVVVALGYGRLFPGDVLAFDRCIIDPNTCNFRNVFIADLRTGLVYAPSPTLTFNFGPVWSPDGMQLASNVLDSGAAYIQIVELDGTSQRFDSDVRVGFPVFSPDGSQLAYIAQRISGEFPGQQVDIWVTDFRDRRNLTNTPETREDIFVWSPDGERLAMIANLTDLHLLTVADGTVDSLSDGNVSRLKDLSWSPGGEWLAYSGATPTTEAVYLTSVNAVGTRLSSTTMVIIWDVSWSPDGHWIAFVGQRRRGMAFHIYLFDTQRRTTRALYVPGMPSVNNLSVLSWSPDSQRIAYQSAAIGGLCIVAIDASGYDCPESLRGGFAPAWRPTH